MAHIPAPGFNVHPLYSYFREFIAPGTDRLALLEKILSEFSLPFTVAAIADSKHIFIAPDIARALSVPGLPVLIAHYDRVPGSPGANDNSAAVFQMIESALKLFREQEKNWLFILTDKEEIIPDGSLREQGSYGLAKIFQELGIRGGRFFIFDACGTGDTIIISTTVDHLLKDREGKGIEKTRLSIQELRTEALSCARNSSIKKILLVPTPFSDDAGFLAAGIAAQTITVLPEAEAAELAKALRLKPQLAGLLVKKGKQHIHELPFIPQTWKRLNGPGDADLFLTPENYSRIVRFACSLCTHP